jgi:hypothetical protein
MEVTTKGGNVWTDHDIESIRAEFGHDLTGEGCTNDLRSVVEVWEFVNNPPERYIAYVSADRGLPGYEGRRYMPLQYHVNIITWAGDTLVADHGTAMQYIALGPVWRSNMGDHRRSIRFRAINGRTYAGTWYFDAGDYCRLKVVK